MTTDVTMLPKRLYSAVKTAEAEHNRRIVIRTSKLLRQAWVKTASFPEKHGPGQDITVYIDPELTHLKEAGNEPRVRSRDEYEVAREVCRCYAYLKGYRGPAMRYVPVLDESFAAVIGSEGTDSVRVDIDRGVERTGIFMADIVRNNILARFGFKDTQQFAAVCLTEKPESHFWDFHSDSYVVDYFAERSIDPNAYPGIARIAMFHEIAELAGQILLLPQQQREEMLNGVGYFWGDQVRRLLKWLDLSGKDVSELLSPDYLKQHTPAYNDWLFERMLFYLAGDEGLVRFDAFPKAEDAPEVRLRLGLELFEIPELFELYHSINSVVGRDVSGDRKKVAEALANKIAEDRSFKDQTRLVQSVTAKFINQGLLKDAISFQEDMVEMNPEMGQLQD